MVEIGVKFMILSKMSTILIDFIILLFFREPACCIKAKTSASSSSTFPSLISSWTSLLETWKNWIVLKNVMDFGFWMWFLRWFCKNLSWFCDLNFDSDSSIWNFKIIMSFFFNVAARAHLGSPLAAQVRGELGERHDVEAFVRREHLVNLIQNQILAFWTWFVTICHEILTTFREIFQFLQKFIEIFCRQHRSHNFRPCDRQLDNHLRNRVGTFA